MEGTQMGPRGCKCGRRCRQMLGEGAGELAPRVRGNYPDLGAGSW